jgi:hypothetical protein
MKEQEYVDDHFHYHTCQALFISYLCQNVKAKIIVFNSAAAVILPAGGLCVG